MLVPLLHENVGDLPVKVRASLQVGGTIARRRRSLQVSCARVMILDLAESFGVLGHPSEIVQRKANILHVKPILILAG